MHFIDAASSLYLDGELVHLEDLVLHDAHMDIRSPTHGLVIAHAVLRARRQICANAPDWATSMGGLAALRDRGSAGPAEVAGAGEGHFPAPERKDVAGLGLAVEVAASGDTPLDRFDVELAEIDALLARSRAALDGTAAVARPSRRDMTLYDEDWDETARLGEWRKVARETQPFPAFLRAALMLDAWNTIDVLQHGAWLGRLLVAATLRETGTTSAHLLAINLGLRDVRWERRRARDRKTRLIAFLEGFSQAGLSGLREHDRLVSSRAQLERKLIGRRSNSRLPQLIDLALSRPLVSAGMIARELKVTQQAAVGLADELGLREMTGRERYRAWGIV